MVIATNGQRQIGGFCGWDFDNLKFSSNIIHNSDMTTVGSILLCYHCHSLARPLIMYGNNRSRVATLFDIRDGQSRNHFQLTSLLNSMHRCKPIKWLENEKVLISEKNHLAAWDFEATKATTLMTFESFGKKIGAIDTIYEEGGNNISNEEGIN